MIDNNNNNNTYDNKKSDSATKIDKNQHKATIKPQTPMATTPCCSQLTLEYKLETQVKITTTKNQSITTDKI